MTLIVDLLKALAALLWPILGFVILYLFKEEIRGLFRRVRKGKILGQELELEASLKELNASAVAASKEADLLSVSDSGQDIIEISEPEDEEEILELAAASPKTALVALSRIIEREARDVLAASGHLKGRKRVALDEAIAEMGERVPKHIPGSVKIFLDVRNRIVHGQGATDDNVLSAIDSGITILRALRAIPRSDHIVHHPGVTVYSDPKATVAVQNIRGVILENVSPGGARRERHIFPTTKDDYEKGQRVSWEWLDGRQWGKVWYRDPDSSEIKEGWERAFAEFVGRPLETI